MADGRHSEEVQRWTAKRRAGLVISLLKGETTIAEAARRHGLTVAEVEAWRNHFLLGPEYALRPRPKEDEALREEELNRFKRKVGETDHGPRYSARGGAGCGCALRRRGRPTSDDDVARPIDAQSVSCATLFLRSAAGARGHRKGTSAVRGGIGRAHSALD